MSKVTKNPALSEAQLRRIAKKIRKETERVLLENGHVAMGKILPITPIDTGNLRGSWFVEKARQSRQMVPTVIIGMRAAYARFVNDNALAFHAPPTQAFFFEEGIRRSKIEKKIPQQIRRVIKEALAPLRKSRAKGGL